MLRDRVMNQLENPPEHQNLQGILQRRQFQIVSPISSITVSSVSWLLTISPVILSRPSPSPL